MIEEEANTAATESAGYGGGGGYGNISVDDVDEDVALEGPLGGKSGWVIEIKGHHFHNSDKELANLFTGKSYLTRTLIKTLLEKEDVVLPTNGVDEFFTYADIGISFPTVTNSIPRSRKVIVFDPTATDPSVDGSMDGGRGGGGASGKFGGGGAGMGMGAGGPGGPGAGGPGMPDMGMGRGGTGATPESSENTFDVYEYKFIVQMAWTPRSEKERLAAREARLAAKAEADAAAAEAAALEEPNDQ